MKPRLARTLSLSLLAILAACGGENGTTPVPEGPPGLRIVSATGITDTVQAVLEPLVVEVRDERGRPAQGVAVEFTSAVTPATGAPELYIHTDQQYASTASAQTDAGGRARVHVAMGSRPGATMLRVNVLSMGLADSALYHVRPGAAARLAIVPRDTTVGVGVRFSPRVSALDRHGNATILPPGGTLSARSASAGIIGMTIEGRSPGRGYVVLDLPGVRDSLLVTVMPAGTLAVQDGGGLLLVRTDGTGVTRVTGPAASPRWLRGGQALVFTMGRPGRLMHVPAAGGPQSPLVAGPDSLQQALDPYPTFFGDWIYFSRARDGLTPPVLWRVRPDGTGAAPVPGWDTIAVMGHPTLSPSGGYVVYEGGEEGYQIVVRNLETREIALEREGETPEWSPSAQWIAYRGTFDGTLWITAPNGSSARFLGSGAYEGRISWSPDAAWLVARSATRSRLELIHVETGEIYPIPGSAEMRDAAWRP